MAKKSTAKANRNKSNAFYVKGKWQWNVIIKFVLLRIPLLIIAFLGYYILVHSSSYSIIIPTFLGLLYFLVFLCMISYRPIFVYPTLAVAAFIYYLFGQLCGFVSPPQNLLCQIGGPEFGTFGGSAIIIAYAIFLFIFVDRKTFINGWASLKRFVSHFGSAILGFLLPFFIVLTHGECTPYPTLIFYGLFLIPFALLIIGLKTKYASAKFASAGWFGFLIFFFLLFSGPIECGPGPGWLIPPTSTGFTINGYPQANACFLLGCGTITVPITQTSNLTDYNVTLYLLNSANGFSLDNSTTIMRKIENNSKAIAEYHINSWPSGEEKSIIFNVSNLYYYKGGYGVSAELVARYNTNSANSPQTNTTAITSFDAYINSLI